MYDANEEPTTWLTIPKWLWQLSIVSGTVLMMWLALLVVPAATVVAVTDIVAGGNEGASVVAELPDLPPLPPLTWSMGSDRCPDSLAAIPGYDAAVPVRLDCVCDAASTQASGSVWGSETYTSDSQLCRAALHAGAVGPEGGRVVVQSAQGCSSYPEVDRHGVRSAAWGEWAGSYYFPSTSQGACSR